ncbi:MAG: chloramphenicol phosphotransferase [Candidatus Latescibacteria bacterium]|nr:chloramphenicol phosphotransferase [Candidatus Latescibacterota bacterium]
MRRTDGLGQIIVLNGVPRAGKSSIAEVLMERFDEPCMNLGVDHFNNHITAKKYSPGIGLRPGGERPDLEPWIVRFYAALYESIAAHSRQGLHVVTDIDHHDDYSEPRGILCDCARRLQGLPALLVGVRCPIDTVWERRRNTWLKGQDIPPDTPPPEILYKWEQAVHTPGIYDLQVDTSSLSPEQSATAILDHLRDGPEPTAFRRLAQIR